MPPKKNTLEKFFSKVVRDPDSGCWIWTGYMDARRGTPYPQFSVDRRMVQAHRWSFERYIRPLHKEDECVIHLCGEFRCVRPEHLGTETKRQNKQRYRAPYCIRGHKRPEQGECPECQQIRAKERWEKEKGNPTAYRYSEEHLRKRREYRRLRYANDQIFRLAEMQRSSRRLRLYNEDIIDPKVLADHLELYVFCPGCGVEMHGIFPAKTAKTLDHIVPINIGGAHCLGNIRALCWNCNNSRPKDGSDLPTGELSWH